MCWNEKVSLATFAIGTAACIWTIHRYIDQPMVIATCILWEFVLLMQVFEAGAWLSQPPVGSPASECNSTNTFMAKGAYIANVCQPIMLVLALFALQSDIIPQKNKIVGSIIIGTYIAWLLYATNKIDEVKCLKPGKNCDNLVYSWWSKFPLGAAVYMGTLITLIITLVRPMNYAFMQLFYILLTFGISAYFYKCGIGSVWCYLAAAAPLLIGPMWEASKQ